MPLAHIHSNVCGQYPESGGKSVCNLTSLDEYTHDATSIAISDKSSETVNKEFTQWIISVERTTGLKVKSLRTDSGGEYQGALMPILRALRIKHELMPPHTPELNGKAERLNRTLNNTVCAMLTQANMPKSLCATSSRIRNNEVSARSPESQSHRRRWSLLPISTSSNQIYNHNE